MKFSAAVFTLFSLCHSVVNGAIRNNPSSLRGGKQKLAQPPKLPIGKLPIGKPRERRLEQGGYIILFEDTIEEVEDFAFELSSSLGKSPGYIMKNTIHGMYLTGLSDVDVEFLTMVEGVAFIE
jgi:hypothetical protein